MNDEIMAYKARLEARSAYKPIWEKKCLSIEEAAAYSSIGIIRTCLHKICVQIFEHNFDEDKAKIRRNTGVLQGFLTQYSTKFAKKDAHIRL